MSTVVLTGCSSGFGLEGALAFARRGDTVFATTRNTNKADALRQRAENEGLDVCIRQLDVTRPATFGPLIQDVLHETGRLDVLVNNAGILRAGAFEDLSDTMVREVVETNFFGPLELTRAVLPHMRKQESGCIIMISSLSGIAGLPGDVAYTASKFALEGATEALRHEVDRWGIRLALVEAGLYATRIFSSSLPGASTLPDDYPEDSPYRALVEYRLQVLREHLPAAPDPGIVGELLVDVANSDGTRLRWPSDDTAKGILDTLLGQSDSGRDEFLRRVAGTKWWSEGKENP